MKKVGLSTITFFLTLQRLHAVGDQTPLDKSKAPTWLEKYGPQISQPFSGPLSFSNLPYSLCLEEKGDSSNFDIAILGLPFDTSVTNRPGFVVLPFLSNMKNLIFESF